jgi:hypothetical protein
MTPSTMMPKSPRDNNLAEMPARFVRRVDDKRTLACIVAERHVAAHPHALLRLRQVTRHRSAASRAEPTGIRLFGCARHRGKLRRDRSYSHALLGRRRGTANKTFSSSRQSGAGLVKSPTVIDGIPPRKSGSHQTRRWREMDSNFQFPVAKPRSVRPAVMGGRAGCSDTGADLWGTEGSNPSLSSGESGANTTPRLRRPASVRAQRGARAHHR